MPRKTQQIIVPALEVRPDDVLFAFRNRGGEWCRIGSMSLVLSIQDDAGAGHERRVRARTAEGSIFHYCLSPSDEWFVDRVCADVPAVADVNPLEVSQHERRARLRAVVAKRLQAEADAAERARLDLEPTVLAHEPTNPLDAFADGLTVRALLGLYSDREAEPLKGFTPAQREALRLEWSRQLREKQKAAREAERNRVVVDTWDD